MAPFFSFASFGGGIASKLLGGASSFSATGGTELTPGDGFKYHVFLSPDNFVVTEGGEVTYLIVAGGGGGGSAGANYDRTPNYAGYSGGGGGGGVLTGTTTISGNTTYPINVGSGTPSALILSYNYSRPNLYPNDPGNLGIRGSSGGDSSFNSMTAYGGGGGGGYSGYVIFTNYPNPTVINGGPGGSGGGGGGRHYGPTATGSGGNGTTGQGYGGGAGGDGGGPPYSVPGGGGGGAGGSGTSSPGSPYSAGNYGDGGPGLAVPEFPAPAIESAIPAPVRPSWTSSVGPTGLYGKGGKGVDLGSGDGIDYTGEGGDGTGHPAGRRGKTGGSGIVIIKYPA